MLIFLLFSDQISWGETFSEGQMPQGCPPPPVEESQLSLHRAGLFYPTRPISQSVSSNAEQDEFLYNND